MREDIRKDVLEAIRRDFAFKRTRGEWLQNGKCPQCGKAEVFARADNPWFVRCGRADKCGWEQSTRERYPEIFDSWSNRFKSSDRDPNAAADAYLSGGRHLDLRGLRGAYSQEWYQDRERSIGSATIRFPLPGGGWWERLIDNPGRFDRKARFAPGKSYSGQVWHRPDLSIADFAAASEIWLAEGIFNTLALEQADVRSASTMSCYNYPEAFLRELRVAIAASDAPGKRPLLVWAFDAGGAGERFTRQFVERARSEGWECAAAQPREEGEDGRDLDWNDLLIFERLGSEKREQYRWNGDLLLAPTAADKALLIHRRHRFASFHLCFRSRTYWATFDAAAVEQQVEELTKARTRKLEDISEDERAEIRAEATRQALFVEEIANCAFRVLYRQRDEATDETCYFLNVDFPSDRPSVKGGFSATALTTAAEFKKRLFAIGTGAIWTGSQHQLDRIMQRQTPRIADVVPLGFTGYCRDHGAYVFGPIAVKDGRVHRPNADDFFSIGKLAIKLGTSERLLDIDYDPEGFDPSWLDDLRTAYGAKGIVALAFYFGTLFAEQVRGEQKSFPFFEMWGLPGSGKTTLVEFLWKLLGRENYEGFDPAKATPAAIARNLGKVANLPVVLIEGDRREEASHSRKFDWEELKTAYNGRSVRARGVKNGGMETFEPPFRGSVVIEQNEPVNASRAINERIMSLGFDQAGWNDETKHAAQRLEQWPIEKLSGFVVHAARRETDVLGAFRQAFAAHERRLLDLPGIRTNRLAKTHGQLLAMLDALRVVLPALRRDVHAEAAELIKRMALERQLVVENEHPDVALFWERFDFLEEREAAVETSNSVNKHRDDTKIAVSLGDFEFRCAELRLSIPSHTDLVKHLKTSKSRRFIGAFTVNTRSGKNQHCWVFERSASGRTAS